MYSFIKIIAKTLLTFAALLVIQITPSLAEEQLLVGKLSGDAEVRQGMLSYSLPLELPAGVHDMRPALSLNYQQGASNGVFGLGFALGGVSSIQRCAADEDNDGFQGAIRFDSNDRYCLNGQRLIVVAGTDGGNGSEYRLRYSPGTKVTAHGQQASGPEYWEVRSADGFIHRYGQGGDSIKLIAGKAQQWYLREQRDRFDNTLTYTYQNQNGLIQLKDIEYSSYTVEFVYQQRPDVMTSYQLGEATTQDNRLSRLQVKRQSQLIYEYRFGYSDSPDDAFIPPGIARDNSQTKLEHVARLRVQADSIDELIEERRSERAQHTDQLDEYSAQSADLEEKIQNAEDDATSKQNAATLYRSNALQLQQEAMQIYQQHTTTTTEAYPNPVPISVGDIMFFVHEHTNTTFNSSFWETAHEDKLAQSNSYMRLASSHEDLAQASTESAQGYSEAIAEIEAARTLPQHAAELANASISELEASAASLRQQADTLEDDVATTLNQQVQANTTSTASESRYSRLSKVTRCDAQGNCLAPLQFDYHSEPAEISAPSAIQQVLLAASDEPLTYVVGDLNKDGNNDLCYYEDGLYCSLNAGDGNFSTATKWTTALDPGAGGENWTNSNDDDRGEEEKLITLSLIDINRDAQPDYCLLGDNGIFCGINENGERFVDSSYKVSDLTIDNAVRFIDIDRDRWVDFCAFKEDGLYCARNLEGTSVTETVKVPGTDFGFLLEHAVSKTTTTIHKTKGDDRIETSTTTETSKTPQPSRMDVNGDGYADICGLKRDPDSSDLDYQCALGHGYASVDGVEYPEFGSPEVWAASLPALSTTQEFIETRVLNRTFRHADINADGLADLCYRRGGDYMCRINTGAGFNAETSWFTFSGADWAESVWLPVIEASISLTDRNGDQLADFCTLVADEQKCAYSDGGAFTNYAARMPVLADYEIEDKSESLYLHSLKRLFGLKTHIHTVIMRAAYGPFKQVSDIDGDGYPDDCYRSHDGISCGIAVYQPLARLVSVTDGYGLRTDFNYSNLASPAVYTPESDAVSPLLDITPATLVINSIVSDNAIGGKNTLEFHYQGYKTHREDGAVGYHKIEKRNLTSGLTTLTEYSTDELLKGTPVRVTQHSNGQLISETASTHEEITDPLTGRERARVSYSVEHDYALDGSLIKTEETHYHAYNAFDQLLRLETVTRGADGIEYRQLTESSYLNDEAEWVLAKPLTIEVTHSVPGDTKKRATAFSYYPNGALRTETIQPGHPLALESTFSYNTEGNLTQTFIKGVESSETRTSSLGEYDVDGRPGLATNALGHTNRTQYHALCGLPVAQTDANGLSVLWEYDGACRKIKETLPDGQVTEWFYQWSDGADAGLDYQSLGLPLGDRSVYMITERNNTTGAWSRIYYDALDREVRTMHLDGNYKYVITDKVYNHRGQIAAATLPYFEGHFPGDNTFWSTIEYDQLGRQLAQHMPSSDGPITTRYEYQGLTTTVIEPNDYRKVTVSDVRDNPVSIDENGASTVSYQYDALGNAIQTNSNGYITTLEYDQLGNKIAMSDPSMGRWEYRYNAFGELIYQKDAKGQEVVLQYDVLGRKTASQQVDGNYHWRYDSAENGLGQLSEREGPESLRRYTYDDLARPDSETLNIDGRRFTTRNSYDQASRIDKVEHADGVVLEHDYTLDGNLKRVSIPKSVIWDYDYLQIEDAFRAILQRIAGLESIATEYESRAGHYAGQLEKFRTLANQLYAQQATTLTETQQIQTGIAELEAALRHAQDRASNYRTTADVAWQAFGSNYLEYQRTTNGYHLYSNTECTNSNWKRHCKNRNSFHQWIEANLIQDTDNCTSYVRRLGKSQDFAEITVTHCVWGPKSRINVSEVYLQAASQWQSEADAIAEQLDDSNAQLAHFDGVADEYGALASNYMALATIYADMARRQTDMLAAISTELEDLRNAAQELETVLGDDTQDDKTVLLWASTSRDAAGRLQGELYGNGLLTRREFDRNTGWLNSIKTGIGNDLLRNLSYSYDKRYNVTSRHDTLAGVSEHYGYDSLDRLQSWQYSDPQRQLARSYSYDSRGNITHKSDAGSMSYAANNRLQSRVDPTGANHTYLYDANGNMQSGDGRSYTWTSFNKVARVSQSGHQVDYRYDSEQNRVSRQANGQTTYYITPGLELVTETDANGEVINRARHNIFVDGQVVATYEKTLVGTTETPDKVAYIHRDALGSVDTVTDSHGNVVMRNQFAPYGENLSANEPSPAFKRHELRGYTGHESVAETGLINMNARLYDPVIGRFISADSVVPEPGMGMAYNRYMYVVGNPLKYSDPTGHWWHFVVAAVLYVIGSTTDDPTIRTVSFAVASALLIANPVFSANTVVSTTIIEPGLAISTTLGATGAAVANGALVGFVNGYFASGGDFGAALQGGIIGGVSGGVTDQIGHGGIFTGENAWFSQALAHGVFQGLISEIQGGEFQAGLASGFVAKVGEHYLEGTALDNVAGVSILGGLASKAAGGDFLQGAIQAAFVYMYNERGDQPQRKPLKSRSMTEGEKKLARTIFKERINYERIKVIDGAYIPTSRPHVSPSGDIYYPGGSYMSDFSTADHVTKAVFMHELTHAPCVRLVVPLPKLGFNKLLQEAKREIWVIQ